MNDRNKTHCIYVVCGIVALAFYLLVTTAPIRGQIITMDTTYFDVGDSTYQMFVLYHQPDSIDTNHIIEFGFSRNGLGWKAKMEYVTQDSTGNPKAVFIYMQDPNFQWDVNQDGKFNVGDMIAMVQKIFGVFR